MVLECDVDGQVVIRRKHIYIERVGRVTGSGWTVSERSDIESQGWDTYRESGVNVRAGCPS